MREQPPTTVNSWSMSLISSDFTTVLIGTLNHCKQRNEENPFQTRRAGVNPLEEGTLARGLGERSGDWSIETPPALLLLFLFLALLRAVEDRRGVAFISMATGAGRDAELRGRFAELGGGPMLLLPSPRFLMTLPVVLASPMSLDMLTSSPKPLLRCDGGEIVGEKASKAGGAGALPNGVEPRAEIAEENLSFAADCHVNLIADEVALWFVLLLLGVGCCGAADMYVDCLSGVPAKAF